MKGPANRRKFRIGRAWQCARCGRRVVTDGQVVHLACVACSSTETTVWMALTQDPLPTPQPPSQP